ncbi:metalloregulator ArsR/SmtB family transcription factor [soil metagenome]
MNTRDDTNRLDLIFSSLSNVRRRGMIYSLALSPATVSQLAREYGLSLPAVHKHIRSMEEARLIYRRKVGRTNFIALNRHSLMLMQEWGMQFNTAWGSDEASLENYIAGMQQH